MAESPSSRKKSLPAGLALIGTEIAGFALVGVAIDYWTGWLRTIPWATLVLSPLGLVAALMHLIQLTRIQKPESPP